MKKWMAFIAAVMMICMACTTVTAAGWVVPSNNSSGGSYSSGGSGYSIDARLIDDLATRSGPSSLCSCRCGSTEARRILSPGPGRGWRRRLCATVCGIRE